MFKQKLVPVVLLGVSVLACGSTPSTLNDPKTGDNDSSVCSAVRPQTEPDLTGWDSGSRAKLSMLRKQGVVAVRYAVTGCNVELEVLDGCIGKGNYSFSPYAANDTKIARNTNELFTSLPLGAAKLGATVRNGKALRTDYSMAGTVGLPANTDKFEPSSLSGAECSKATHVIRTIYLGGFAMASGQVSEIEGGASLFGIGAGGGKKQSMEHLASEGIAEACVTAQKDGQESAQCSVPLRVSLLPIKGRETMVTTPAPTIAEPSKKTPPSTPATPSSSTSRPANQDSLGRLAFEALKNKDFEALQRLVATEAEFREFAPDLIQSKGADNFKSDYGRLREKNLERFQYCLEKMGGATPKLLTITPAKESNSSMAGQKMHSYNDLAIDFEINGKKAGLVLNVVSELTGKGWTIAGKIRCDINLVWRLSQTNSRGC